MKRDATYAPTAAELRRGVRLHPARRHLLRLRAKRLAVVEVEDVLFATGSAVVFPAALGNDGVPEIPSGDAPMRATGLGLLFVALHHAAQHPEQRLLICGHTDAEGGARANLALSEARAAAVYSLLSGDRRLWQQTCAAYHRPEDVQALLAYFARARGVDAFDPGPVDGDLGPRTNRATRAFQAWYNRFRPEYGVGDRPALDVDGAFGAQTWGAVYDFYRFDLAQMMGGLPRWVTAQLLGAQPQTPADGAPRDGASPSLLAAEMARWERNVHLVDPATPYLGLGESFPIAPAHRDGARSQADRRVELLFFDEEDVPALPAGPSNGDYFTPMDCPFYDPGAYARTVVEPGELFQRELTFQAVDEVGAPVADAEVVVVPLLGGRFEATADADGIVHVEGLPPGVARIDLPDGTNAHVQAGVQRLPALLRTTRVGAAEVALAPVIVKEVLEDHERVQAAEDVLFHDRSRPRRRFRPRGAQAAPIPDAEPEIISADEAGADEAAAVEPPEPETPPPGGFAHDNLALVAAQRDRWAGGRLAPQAVYEALREWVGDRFPQAAHAGYALFLLQGDWLLCYAPDGTQENLFPLRPGARERLRGSIGAYAIFATGSDPVFRDMVFRRRVVTLDGREGGGVIPMLEILRPEAERAFTGFVDRHAARAQVLYFAPQGGEVGALALRGGCGLLEAYGGSGAFRERVHARNLDTVRMADLAHRSAIAQYIGQVESVGPPDLEQLAAFADQPALTRAQKQAARDQLVSAVRTAVAQLRALGPPPPPYRFPWPTGATDEEFAELFEAAGSSEFGAWKALSQRIDKLMGQHSQGAVFFRVKYTIEATRANNAGAGEAPRIGQSRRFRVEHNIDFGSDGLLAQRNLLSIGEATVGTGENARLPMSGGIEEEVNVESGARKTTVKGSIRDMGVEVGTDGGVKLTAPHGTSAEYNVQAQEAGFGQELDLGPAGKLYVGLHLQLSLEETVQAYFAHAPGFFERRHATDYADPDLRWVDLDLRERTLLDLLGWDADSWDRRGATLFADFPETIRKEWFELTDEEAAAAIQLGFDRRLWAWWPKAARLAPASITG